MCRCGLWSGLGGEKGSRMKNRIVVALVVVCVVACQQDQQNPPGPPSVVRDSAEIRIVENANPPEGSRLPWRIGPEPTVSIGVLEGEEPYMLHRVIDAIRLSDGRIAVANKGTEEVRVFDAHGVHLVTFGGRGEGPGDFRSLWRVKSWPGDSILAWQLVNRRFSIFDSNGNYGRSFVLQSDENASSRRSLPLVATRGDGTIVSIVEGDADSTGVEIVDGEGRLLVSLGAYPDEDMITARGSRGYTERMPAAYSRELVTSLWGDLVVASPNHRYEIRAFGADGALARIVRREHALRIPTEADKQFYLDREIALRDAPDVPAGLLEEMRRVFGSVPVAETFPAFSTILADDAGYLWVREYDFPGEERPAPLWTVFDPEGHVLGFMETSNDLRIHHIGEDYVVVGVQDELGVQSIQVRPLERAGR